MTTPRLTRSRAQAEHGSALIGVLLLLMMMSGLAAALAVSGRTETLIARNHQTAAQARVAAEAGLNHASQAAIAWLAGWPALYASANQAVNAMLANPDGTLGFDFVATPDCDPDAITPIAGAADEVGYQVSLMDEDDLSRVDAGDPPITLEDDADATNDEDGDPDTDNNRSVVLRVAGCAQDNSSAVLEAIVAPLKLPAIISDGDLTLSGSVTIIAGDNGGVHANGDLTISGSGLITGIDPDTGLPDVDNGTATASGTYTDSVSTVVTGNEGGGYGEKTLPKVRASFYRSWADYVLESTGQATCNAAGGCNVDGVAFAYNATVCDASSNPHNQCRPSLGWVYDDGDQSWNLNLNSPDDGDGSYYVEGRADISGSPGSALDPLNVTIFAEGSIDVSGGPYLTPDSTEILFVTDQDLNISGNLNMPLAEGQILVHEQANINSSAVLIQGQLVIEDADDVSSLVTSSSIQGATITYTGDVGNTLFTIAGWREVR